jgi:hypothetical protein
VAGESDSSVLDKHCDLTSSQNRQRENLIHLAGRAGRGLAEFTSILVDAALE